MSTECSRDEDALLQGEGGLASRARGPIYAIHPSVLIDKMLVMRTDVGEGYLSFIQNDLPNHFEGLKIATIHEIED